MTNEEMQPPVHVATATEPAICYCDLEALSKIFNWENEIQFLEIKYHTINFQAILGRRWLAPVAPDLIVSAGTLRYRH
jgi:hypothetical protein